MFASARSLGALVLVGACVTALTGAANGTSASRASGWAIRDLGTLGGNSSAATAINNRGQIVGWSTTRSGAKHAFLWQRGTMRDLGTLGGAESAALALNERGQIVGWSTTKKGTKRAVIWGDGGIRLLPWARPAIQIRGGSGEIQRGGSSIATGINESGDVTGYWWLVTSSTPGVGGVRSACRGPGATCSFGGVWHKGEFGGLGSVGGSANAINDAGVVVRLELRVPQPSGPDDPLARSRESRHLVPAGTRSRLRPRYERDRDGPTLAHGRRVDDVERSSTGFPLGRQLQKVTVVARHARRVEECRVRDQHSVSGRR